MRPTRPFRKRVIMRALDRLIRLAMTHALIAGKTCAGRLHRATKRTNSEQNSVSQAPLLTKGAGGALAKNLGGC